MYYNGLKLNELSLSDIDSITDIAKTVVLLDIKLPEKGVINKVKYLFYYVKNIKKFFAYKSLHKTLYFILVKNSFLPLD